jgi:hypothetical protein
MANKGDDVKVETPSLDNQSIFALAGKISGLLSGVSKKQQREILSLVASQQSYRLVPIGVAIATSSQGGGARAPKPKVDKGLAVVKPSFDKSNPEWVRLNQTRDTIVNQLKTAAEADKPKLKVALRDCEGSILALKHRLQGK